MAFAAGHVELGRFTADTEKANESGLTTLHVACACRLPV